MYYVGRILYYRVGAVCWQSDRYCTAIGIVLTYKYIRYPRARTLISTMRRCADTMTRPTDVLNRTVAGRPDENIYAATIIQ